MRHQIASLLEAFADDPDEFFRRMKVLKRRVKRKLRYIEKNATVPSILARVAARRLRHHG